MQQNKWKTVKIARLKRNMEDSVFVVEGMCPYCKRYSTQLVYGDGTGAYMYYRYCPRCGKELITNDNNTTQDT